MNTPQNWRQFGGFADIVLENGNTGTNTVRGPMNLTL